MCADKKTGVEGASLLGSQLDEARLRIQKAIQRLEYKHPGSIPPWVKQALMNSADIQKLDARPTRFISGRGEFFSQVPQLGDAVRYATAWYQHETRTRDHIMAEELVAAFLEGFFCHSRRHLADFASRRGIKLYPNKASGNDGDSNGSRDSAPEIERLVKPEHDLEFLDAIQREMSRFRPFQKAQQETIHFIEAVLKANRDFGAEMSDVTSEKAADQFEAARKLIHYYGRFPSVPHSLSRCLASWSQFVMLSRFQKSVSGMREQGRTSKVELQRLQHHLDYIAHLEGRNAEDQLAVYRDKLARLTKAYPVLTAHMDGLVARIDEKKQSMIALCIDAVHASRLYVLLEAKLEA